MERILNIEERILNLPEEIKKQQTKLISVSIAQEDKRKQTKKIELEVSAKIAKDETLTNEIKRKSALAILLEDNGTYQGLLTDIVLLDGQLRAEQIELDYLHNLFRAFITVAQIKGVK